jgi:hypothetical protein
LKSKKKQLGIILTVFLSVLLTLAGCSSTNSAKTANASLDKKNSSSETSKKETTLTIVSGTANQDGQMIAVDIKMKNNTSSAQTLKPELFALVSNSTIISPDAKSDIPQQIPAETNAEFKMEFDPKGLDGTIPLKLAYQPVDSSKTEQFFEIGNFTIKKPVVISPSPQTAKSSASETTATNQQEKATDPNKIDLQIQTLDAIKVLVPVGWIKSPHDGGDFSGFQFINPKDGNQQMLVVTSTCAGCGYPNADSSQTPNPISLIPEHTVSTYLFKDGLSAGYTYYLTGNSYPGNGVVKMKKEGYGLVEIVLPDSQKAFATKILNSFQFFGVY